MVKVIATGVSEQKGIGISEFHRIVKAGEIFEVTEDRFNILSGNNKLGLKFVERYEEPEVTEPTTYEVPTDESVEEVVEEKTEDAPVEEVTVEEVVETAPVEEGFAKVQIKTERKNTKSNQKKAN